MSDVDVIIDAGVVAKWPGLLRWGDLADMWGSQVCGHFRRLEAILWVLVWCVRQYHTLSSWFGCEERLVWAHVGGQMGVVSSFVALVSGGALAQCKRDCRRR